MPEAQGMYQPAGVPAETAGHPGMTQGIGGIVCAVISTLILPPVFGLIGIILGILSVRKGEKALGITAIVLSAVFMIVGMIFGAYVAMHPELFELESEAMPGAVIHSLIN